MNNKLIISKGKKLKHPFKGNNHSIVAFSCDQNN